MAGRRTVITDQMMDRFLEAIESGNTIKNACGYAGIAPATFHSWKVRIERGERMRSDTYRRISRFLDLYRVSEAKAQKEAVERIRRAGRGEHVIARRTTTRTLADGTIETVVTEEFAPAEWRADAWLLERRNPAEWGRRDRTPVDMEREARRLAEETGVPIEEIWAEAEAIANGR